MGNKASESARASHDPQEEFNTQLLSSLTIPEAEIKIIRNIFASMIFIPSYSLNHVLN
jgi:hypothetical protein